jgi:AcrR family transcriptional regulator
MSEPAQRREQERGRDTRDRVLAAASAEFTEHGVAGARINRIAEAAHASKERIYAWFGDKDALFDQVMRRGLDDLARAVPITTDLVDYTLRLHDHFVEHPRSQRVAIWAWVHDSRGLDEVSEDRLDGYRHKLAVIEEAQRLGLADSSWSPASLLALILSTATSWLMAPVEVHIIAPAAEHRADRRQAVEEAARRLILPR